MEKHTIQEIWQELDKIDDNGSLYEDSLKDAINNIVDTYKTSGFSHNASMYIMPDGVLLNLGDSGYGHSNVSEYLNNIGLEVDYEIGTASKLLYSLGWIRVNNRWKFVTLPNKAPTDEQYKQLLVLFDFYKNDYQVSTIDGQSKTYKDRTPDEVIKLIKRYYSSGTLYEHVGKRQ